MSLGEGMVASRSGFEARWRSWASNVVVASERSPGRS